MKALKCLMRWSGFLVVSLVFTVAPASAQDKDKPQVIVDRAVTTLTDFALNPALQKHIKEAKGVFVVPTLMQAGESNGVLMSRVPGTSKWSYPAFYSMGSAALPADVDKAELVLLIMTDKSMSAMLSGKFRPGVDASLAAGSASATGADILQFTRSKGAFGGLTVEAATIAVHDKLNQEYYAKEVLTAADILIKHEVQIAGADALRRLVASTAR